MKSFSNYFVSKMILLNIPRNIAIYSFKYFVSHIMVISRECSFILQHKYFLVLHNFKKYFNSTKVSHIVNKCLNGFFLKWFERLNGLVFSLSHFRLCKKCYDVCKTYAQ